MIKPNELRIGICVYKKDAICDNDGVHIKERLHIIDHNDIYHIIEDGDPTNHPIPLTPEWLIKFGFYKEDKLNVGANTWWKDGMGEYITFNYDGLCIFQFGNKRPVKYVHQLQNLYLGLTGEELTIKETA